LPNGGVSDSGGNSADYGMCIFCVAIRGLEKEQEGLVKEQIEELLKRITCLEAEVAELKRKQWTFEPLKERVEVIGGYYPNVNTVGAGIQ
jgi:hypothetical protein